MDLIETNKEKIIETTKKIVGFMNLECQVELREELGPDNKVNLMVSMYTPDNARFLIGKNGQNLKAFEHLVRSIFMSAKIGKDESFAHTNQRITSISVDVNDYRRSRTSFVIDMAKQAVSRVRNSRKAETLLPMSAYERRMVHLELASCPDIETESIGDEPQRKIVIKPFP
ncbi:MAG: R3H domain-containing nucleic acid-binding protein [Candidatus Paceibacterota bacterium]